MDTKVIASTEVPVKTLQEELSVISATAERRFLLYRIAGSSIEASLSYLHLKIGSYNGWLEKPAFRELNRRRAELEVGHRSEAVKLLRKENQIGAVIIEERIIETLLQELEDKEYNLMRTPIAKTVYDKLMQDIDAMPTINVKAKMNFIDRMAILMGGNNDSQAEDSQSTQFTQSQPLQISVQGSNQVQEAVTEERIITGNPMLDGVVVEGEIIDGEAVDVTFREVDAG